MYKGWRYFLREKLRGTSSFYALGIEINSDHVSAAAFKLVNGVPRWELQQQFPIDSWQQALPDWVADHHLQNTPTHVALALGQYRMMQVEKPTVPDEELKQALTWSVAELIPNSGELAVDYFDIPIKIGGADKINVVAVPRERLSQWVDTLMGAELKLQSIGVTELVICDLLQSEPEAVITLMQEKGEEMSLSIIKDGKLFFNRQLKGYERLADMTPEEMAFGMFDSLSLEIQRSMDYFESQLKQAPIKRILLAVETGHLGALCTGLHTATALDVDPLTAGIERADEIQTGQQWLAAIGAGLQDALRESES